MRTDLTLRPATPVDAPAMADVHVASRTANLGSLPPLVHDLAETRGWMQGRLEGSSVGWVALAGDRLVGYLVLTADWLDDLYLAPGETGQGVGSALLEVAKAQRPDGFQLWAFETNTGARRFYERHGLIALEATDGSTNQERAPDVRLAWPGREPLVFLRRLIDDVDDQLGELLARRVALTRAVQPHKDDPTRDPAREREVVARMARHAPELGEDRLARIVHAIITESLDAAT